MISLSANTSASYSSSLYSVKELEINLNKIFIRLKRQKSYIDFVRSDLGEREVSLTKKFQNPVLL